MTLLLFEPFEYQYVSVVNFRLDPVSSVSLKLFWGIVLGIEGFRSLKVQVRVNFLQQQSEAEQTAGNSSRQSHQSAKLNSTTVQDPCWTMTTTTYIQPYRE